MCLLQSGVSAQNETIEFNSFYDSVSFALGADNAASLYRADAKFERLDKIQLIEGFQANLFGEPVDEQCEKTVEKFLGATRGEFNTDYLKEGSKCVGNFIGFQFYGQMKQIQSLEDLNMSLVLQGFKNGIYKQNEKFLSLDAKKTLLTKFGKIAESNFLAEIEISDRRFWSKVLQIPGIQQIENTGIYVETIEQGAGGKPTATSDVETHYILTNSAGDTLENSYKNGASLKINLGVVIAGWKEGFPALEKGGKYRLYVPYEKAYKGGRREAPQGALCFYIEFINFGEQGSIAQPPPRITRQN